MNLLEVGIKEQTNKQGPSQYFIKPESHIESHSVGYIPVTGLFNSFFPWMASNN